MVVVEVVGEWRPRVQNGSDSRGAPPCSKAHGPSDTSPQVVVHPVCSA